MYCYEEKNFSISIVIVSEEFLKVQDEYLKQRNEERGITDIRDLKPVMTDNRLYIWQGDITTFSTVKAFLDKDSRIEKVIFNVFKDEDLRIYRELLA